MGVGGLLRSDNLTEAVVGLDVVDKIALLSRNVALSVFSEGVVGERQILRVGCTETVVAVVENIAIECTTINSTCVDPEVSGSVQLAIANMDIGGVCNEQTAL